MKRFLAGGVLVCVLATGCTVIPSTTRRALVTGVGAAAGGAAGYGLGDKKPGWTIAGAGMGALATGLALGKDPELAQASFDNGYVQGQADAIKRQYFLRQQLEAKPLASENAQGKTVHYVMPGPTVTADGTKLEPHTVTVSVTE
jgi:hypothetical protein